jgi:hypothetical protein
VNSQDSPFLSECKKLSQDFLNPKLESPGTERRPGAPVTWVWEKGQAESGRVPQAPVASSLIQSFSVVAANREPGPYSSLFRPRPGANLEPIPTQWPDAKLEAIPTQWPNLKRMLIEAPLGAPAMSQAR